MPHKRLQVAGANERLLPQIDPWLLAGLLYLGSGLGLTGYRLAVARRGGGARTEARLVRADMPWLAAAMFFGGVVGPLLLMVGLRITPASSVSPVEFHPTCNFAWVSE